LSGNPTSGGAAIAAGHPLTAEAAAQVLRAGGNAFDAAVAAGFASAMTEPGLTSLGGGGFIVARTAEKDEVLFDFFVDTPGRGRAKQAAQPHFFPVTVSFGASEQDFNVGLASVAVPGNLKGYLHVHRRLGRLPLADVVAPAVDLARNGVRVTRHQAYLLTLLTPILTHAEEGRQIYAPQGRVLREGETLVNPNLSRFLESLPRTGEWLLYAGELARRVAGDMRLGAGLLTGEDLAAYEVIERKPLAVDYRGRRLLTNPAPSFGGSLLALSLRLLATQDLAPHAWGSVPHLDLLAALMVESDALRNEGTRSIGELSDERREQAVARLRRSSGGTTHVSIADGEGNVASMTTSNGEGSGYVVPQTGIMLNNMMGEDDLHPEGFHVAPPGQRVSSMMAPSLLLCDDRVELVVGSGGSKRIRTALLQVISHIVDYQLDLSAAVEAARLHWDGEALQIEPGFAPNVVAELGRRWPLNVWPDRNLYFGGVNAVSPNGQAGADSRRGGAAILVPSRG
jgi:gamma-glutamyltranspeptidase/glutathione hydrolase